MAESSKKDMSNIVGYVEKRVEILIEEHRKATELNRELLEERNKLQVAKRELQKQLQALQIELDKRILQDGLEDATKDQKRATAYVNRLIREVDNCIALISTVK